MGEIQPHRHCPVCGISMPADQEFCSKKCEDRWNAVVKQKKKVIYLMRILVAVVIGILLVSMLLR